MISLDNIMLDSRNLNAPAKMRTSPLPPTVEVAIPIPRIELTEPVSSSPPLPRYRTDSQSTSESSSLSSSVPSSRGRKESRPEPFFTSPTPKPLSREEFLVANRRLETLAKRPRRASAHDRRGRKSADLHYDFDRLSLHPQYGQDDHKIHRSRSLSPSGLKNVASAHNDGKLESAAASAEPSSLSPSAAHHHARSNSLRSWHEYQQVARQCDSPQHEITEDEMRGSSFLKSARSVLSLSKYRNSTNGSPGTLRASTYPQAAPKQSESPEQSSCRITRRHTHTPIFMKSSDGVSATTSSSGAYLDVTPANFTAALEAMAASLEPTDPTNMRLPKSPPIDKFFPFDSPTSTPPIPIKGQIIRADSSDSVVSVRSTQWCSVDYNLVQDDWKSSRLKVVNAVSSNPSSAPSSPPRPRTPRASPLRLHVVGGSDTGNEEPVTVVSTTPSIKIVPPPAEVTAAAAAAKERRMKAPDTDYSDGSLSHPLRRPLVLHPGNIDTKSSRDRGSPPRRSPSPSPTKSRSTALSAEPMERFHFPPPPSSQPPPEAVAAKSNTLTLGLGPRPPTPPRVDSKRWHHQARSASTVDDYREFEATHRRDVEAIRLERRKSLTPGFYREAERRQARMLQAAASHSSLSAAAANSPRSSSRLATFFKAAIRGRRKSLPTNRPHTVMYISRHAARSAYSFNRPNHPQLPDYLMQYAERGAPAANVDFDPIKMASVSFKDA